MDAPRPPGGYAYFLLRFRFAFFFRPFLRPEGFFGTFAPSWRASDSPIAMACSRLLTRFPERPLRSVPRLRSRIRARLS